MDKAVTKMEIFVSIVLILDDWNATFSAYLTNLAHYLDQRYSDYEIVIIDQNTKPFPPILQKELLKNISSIRWIKLAFPVEMDVALSAGIENSIGDFVLLLRPSIDPIDMIDDMIQESANGYDVIVGVAEHPRTLGYKIARKIGNVVLHSINYHIPKNSTPVRCLSRRTINTVLRTGQLSHQFFIKIANTGYPTKNYSYSLLNPESLAKRTLFSGIAQSLQLMVFNSTKPLRWISVLGVLGSFFAFIFALYSIVVNILKNNVADGWTSMVFFTSFLFMILFIILAFLGEYMARLLNENNGQKSYDVSSEETSAVMLEIDRFNVLHQS
jgi:hypothetical protein